MPDRARISGALGDGPPVATCQHSKLTTGTTGGEGAARGQLLAAGSPRGRRAGRDWFLWAWQPRSEAINCDLLFASGMRLGQSHSVIAGRTQAANTPQRTPPGPRRAPKSGRRMGVPTLLAPRGLALRSRPPASTAAGRRETARRVADFGDDSTGEATGARRGAGGCWLVRRCTVSFKPSSPRVRHVPCPARPALPSVPCPRHASSLALAAGHSAPPACRHARRLSAFLNLLWSVSQIPTRKTLIHQFHPSSPGSLSSALCNTLPPSDPPPTHRTSA